MNSQRLNYRKYRLASVKRLQDRTSLARGTKRKSASTFTLLLTFQQREIAGIQCLELELKHSDPQLVVSLVAGCVEPVAP